MSGIKANSLSVTMLDGDTAIDKEIGGFIDDELVTLTTSPTGSVYTWALSKPETSTARANLSATSGATVTFTPDVEGVYHISATVDANAYQMRLTAIAQTQANVTQTIRFQNTTDASIPTPLNGGVTLFNSDQFEGLSFKLDDGTIGRIYPLAGEANTMSSAGSGASIVLTKSGVDLPVRGFVGLNDITCTASGNDLQVDGAALLALDGDRAMTGNLDMGTYAITNVGNVDGVDISDHSARHENGGADEISVAGLSGLLADPQTPLAHAATHKGGGSDVIDNATTSLAGLMSAADKLAHDYAVELNTVSEEKSGIAEDERTDSTMTFTDGSRQFQIAPTVTSYDIWIKGIKTTKSGTEQVNWTDVEGVHFFYFNSSGTLTHSTNETAWIDVILGNGVALAALYWDATNNVSFQRLEERHGLKMDGETHRNLHLTRGAQWITGGALGDIIADGGGGLDSHAQLSVETVTIADEDIQLTFSDGSPQTLAVPAQIPVYYRLGAGGLWRKRTANTFPMIYSGDGSGYVGGSGRVPYNLNTAGTWSLSEVGNNDFVLVHFFATTDVAEPIIAIQGQASYGNIISARTGATTEINSLQLGQLDGLAAEHTKLGTIILQTNGGYANTPNCQIRSTDLGADYVDFRFNENVGNSGGATDHDSLSGVAASVSHTNYLLLSGGTMTGDIAMGGNNVTNAGFVSVGANASTIGALRLTNNEWLTSTDSTLATNVDVLRLSSADFINFGASSTVAGIIYRAASGGRHTWEIAGASEFNITSTLVDAQDNTIRTTGILEAGTNPAASGRIRLDNSGFINSRNAANTGDFNVIGVTGSDVLNVGTTTTLAALSIRVGSSGTIDANVGGTIEFEVSTGLVDAKNNTIRTTGVIEVGTNPATTGAVRFANNDRLFWRNAANSANIQALTVATDDAVYLGDAAAATTVVQALTRSRYFVGGTKEFEIRTGVVDAQDNIIRTTGVIEVGTNPAASGTYRGPNTTTALNLRNNANSADVTAIGISTSDEIEVGLAATVKLGDTDMNGNDIIDVGVATSNAETVATSSSGAITVTWAASNLVVTTLTENITSITLTPPTSGKARLDWTITQAAASSYTVAGWPTTVKWAGGTPPTMTTTNSAWDIITLKWNGTNYSGTYAQAFGP